EDPVAAGARGDPVPSGIRPGRADDARRPVARPDRRFAGPPDARDARGVVARRIRLADDSEDLPARRQLDGGEARGEIRGRGGLRKDSRGQPGGRILEGPDRRRAGAGRIAAREEGPGARGRLEVPNVDDARVAGDVAEEEELLARR